MSATDRYRCVTVSEPDHATGATYSNHTGPSLTFEAMREAMRTFPVPAKIVTEITMAPDLVRNLCRKFAADSDVIKGLASVRVHEDPRLPMGKWHEGPPRP